nr:MAG TPA: hypothetical protein [Caudoviricetes sp.]
MATPALVIKTKELLFSLIFVMELQLAAIKHLYIQH